MNAEPSSEASSAAAQKLSRAYKVLIATVVVGFVAMGTVILTSRKASHAARVAEGLRQNERMAGDKDCPWDGRPR